MQKLFGLMEYLSPLRDPKFNPTLAGPPAARSPAALRSLDYLIALFKHRALLAVYESGQRLAVRVCQCADRVPNIC